MARDAGRPPGAMTIGDRYERGNEPDDRGAPRRVEVGGDSEPIAARRHPSPLGPARATKAEYLVHDVPLSGSVYAVTEKGGS
ncbi:hypothetical protein [Micromonospora sp. S4605]|uniref:hypothetical protein n=1 Tax=Micromonospora sp. S4605 TaxID=1420897 RepID=UPI0011B7A801|nr:hypothetical protein [Micromonospora sp. S4605]